MTKILITVCARGGSKGIPGKNIKVLLDKPLIFYTLKVANAFAKQQGNTIIVLSTDSTEIKTIVEGFNFDSVDVEYDRPDSLAIDSSGKLDAIKDVRNFAQEKYALVFDYVMDLDVTSPLRSVDDLFQAFEVLKKNEDAFNIFSVNSANRNPYFNMVEEAKNGFFKLCKESNYLTRQSAPKVYDMNASFYIYRHSFFEAGYKGAITEKSLVYVVPHICFDLDHSIDFDFMTYLLEHNKLDFKFLK